MSEPANKKLYETVKKLADSTFKEKTSIYKSSWIVNTYKKRGGKYKGKKPVKAGLTRWYSEKWIDLNRPIKNKKGEIVDYQVCGRLTKNNTDLYPLCRPSVKVTEKTPKTYKEIPKENIEQAKKNKQKIKGTGSVSFNT